MKNSGIILGVLLFLFAVGVCPAGESDGGRIEAILAQGRAGDVRAVDALAQKLEDRDVETACAAAWSLGQIAAPDAVEALTKAGGPREVRNACADALLNCAEVAVGKEAGKAASAIYVGLFNSDRPVRYHIAALRGLTGVDTEQAWPLIKKGIDSEEAGLRVEAIRLTAQIPGRAVTEELVKRMEKLPALHQAIVVEALAKRNDPAADSAIVAMTESENEQVRIAAVNAFIQANIAGEKEIGRLLEIAAGDSPAVQAAARRALVRIPSDELDSVLLPKFATSADRASRVEAIIALAGRQGPKAARVLQDSLSASAAEVRIAAWRGLGQLAEASSYLPMAAKLGRIGNSREAEQARLAVRIVGRGLANYDDRVDPVIGLLEKGSDAGKPLLLRVLAGFGGDKARKAVWAHCRHGDPAIRDAAIRALVEWPDVGAADHLLELARNTPDKKHRILALRGYIRLAQTDREDGPAMLKRIGKIAESPEQKRLLLSALYELGGAQSLAMVAAMLDDPQVRGNAELSAAVGLAILEIGSSMGRSERDAVGSAMEQLISKGRRPDFVERAKAILERIRAKVDVLTPAPYGRDQIDKRRAELGEKAESGLRLVCYLDCGVDPKCSAGGIEIEQLNGGPWAWPGAASAAAGPFWTVAFDGGAVNFGISGLKRDKQYYLGFSWWDYDNNRRSQAVTLSGSGKSMTLAPSQALPAYSGSEEKPAEIVAALPGEFTGGGSKVTVGFQRRGASNAVVSEIWLYEGGALEQAVKGKEAPSKAEKQVLIVTGIDYPGHKWKLTAPVLAEGIAADKRLGITVTEKPSDLAKDDLGDYDVIVLHFMNWETPDPGAKARANLKEYVRAGGGLVLVHFACGAFQEWPEFVELAGRVWDPKLRGHDPHGKFTVEIAKAEHPIFKGTGAFETVDELYTCLTGKTAIEVLATSRSKVDGKDYPMAFVLKYGRGRVFHSVLGHDVRALANPAVKRLFRRACAWTAGLEPSGQ